MATPMPGALGRGLSSLLSTSLQQSQGTPFFLPAARIQASPDQPRRHFSPGPLQELAGSIAEQGILQPLIVTPIHNGFYRLIAGERRLRAAKLVGLAEVPVVVRHASQVEAFELALLENIQREDLNPIEEAHAYRRLIEEHGYTQEAVARRVGKGRPTISNALRLLNLDETLQERVLRGEMSAGHARALLGTDDLALREHLALRIHAEGLSVRSIERLVSKARSGPSKDHSPATETTPALKRLTNRLQGQLGRNIRIRTRRRGTGGTLVIAFDDDTDLRALVTQLSI